MVGQGLIEGVVVDTQSAFRALTSHKNCRQSSTAMATYGHKWPQMVGCPAECGWPLSVPFRKLKESEGVRQTVSHALHPGKRGRRIQSLRAFRRTDSEGLWVGELVLWCVGCWGLPCRRRLSSSEALTVLQHSCWKVVVLWHLRQ